MACSATFHGLASLLVHQASHASEVSGRPDAISPTCSHCGGLFASKELLETHSCMLLPPSVTPDFHLCECGEVFQEIGAFQEHKKLHDMKTITDPVNDSCIKIEIMTDGRQFQPDAPVLSAESSTSQESLNETPQAHSEAEQEECLFTSDVSPIQHFISQGHHDELLPTCVSSPVIFTDGHSDSFKNKTELEENENFRSSDDEESPELSTRTDKSLIKMLASAYMSCRQPSQIQWSPIKRALPPRKVSPRAPVQSPEAKSASNFECTVNQLRQKVAKYAPSQDGCIPLDRIFSKKSSIVSMTKALCPVVALETRQKLFGDNVEGRYQCGTCRRIFQDKDSLILHHVLHRKERVKFCRHCQQLVLSVISVPDVHICSDYAGTDYSFLTALYPTKFQCQLCNRSYTRRHRLKTHKCQPLAASAQNGATASNVEVPNARGQHLSLTKSTGHVTVAVNTESINSVKTEESADTPMKEKFQVNHDSFKPEMSPKSFPPFCPSKSKCALLESKENVGEMLKRKYSINSSSSESEKNAGSNTEESDWLERGQWTIPLDDAEIDVLTDEENCNNLDETSMENTDDEVIILEPSVNCGTTNSTHPINKDYRMHASDDGIRRFSCNRCQKSYSRRFTLNQHLRICRTRKLTEPNSYGNVSANILGVKKRFPCPHCSSSFSRKDNMNMHRRRCQSMRGTNPGTLVKQNQAAQENVFVLPPVSNSQARQESSSSSTSGSGSWGIMSLPSVLPRKVTCDCGACFTCPRLLFEHLQMHALESYICSRCGENFQSWADFEAHQQLHLETSRSKIEETGAQQQLQEQPQLQQEPNIQPVVENLKKDSQNQLKSRLNPWRLTGPYVCHRCKKLFRLRKSLLRHLTQSCKGESASENKHSCSRCGMTFENALAQEVHMRRNTCTPAFKPLCCPVCVRWFSSLEGLKRHLLLHSKESLTCQICGCKCSSHAALEEHKLSVHGTKKDSESPSVQSAHVSQSSSADNFRCQICQRSYPKLQSLKDHLRKVHRPKHLNAVKADISDTKASSEGIVQYSQSKQFQCHICARTYQDLQSLKNHKRRVHRILGGGLQPSRGSLQQSHSIQFQCQICSRTYPDIRSLRNHRRRVHHILGGLGPEQYKGISLFKCQICQRSYPDIGALNNHKRMEHCILRGVLESPKMDATHLEQSQTDNFHVTDPSGNFEPTA